MSRRTLPRPTILDVAARAGVSKSLVSNVLRGASAGVSDSSRRRVLDAARELGYRPNAAARSLVQRRTNLVGMLLADLHNPFFAELVDGVQACADHFGYDTILESAEPGTPAERGALNALLELRVDGVILASPMSLDLEAITAVGRELPVVLVAQHATLPTVDSVSNDDDAGAALAVNHLADLGHVDIAHIGAVTGAGAAARRLGYERAMARRGLARHTRVVDGAYTEEGGRQGVAALLAAGAPPTAIFAANDLAALGILSALAERGVRVPDDVSVVGYDNTALAALRLINLTTIDQPRPELGRTAVTLLHDRLRAPHRPAPIPARHVVIAPRLVVRGTTAPPRLTA